MSPDALSPATLLRDYLLPEPSVLGHDEGMSAFEDGEARIVLHYNGLVPDKAGLFLLNKRDGRLTGEAHALVMDKRAVRRLGAQLIELLQMMERTEHGETDIRGACCPAFDLFTDAPLSEDADEAVCITPTA